MSKVASEATRGPIKMQMQWTGPRTLVLEHMRQVQFLAPDLPEVLVLSSYHIIHMRLYIKLPGKGHRAPLGPDVIQVQVVPLVPLVVIREVLLS